MSKPTVGSLFAGIGGIDLGFERAGFKTLWQVEIDPYCRKVLERHFPDAERFEDVRRVGIRELRPVDVIAGGFPCQDISNAGRQAGITGARSGLFYEALRIISELRPAGVLLENVAALLVRGMGEVLGGLSEIGYDAEWDVISAADVNAPHIRERVWILAYPRHEGVHEQGRNIDAGQEMQLLRRDGQDGLSWKPEVQGQVLVYANIIAKVRSAIAWGKCNPWAPESSLARVANGVPSRVDRLRGLGNAVVPQIPELIARRIREVLSDST